MNALPVLVAEFLTLQAGTVPASPAAEGADSRSGEMPRPAADFAALLLSAGLGVEALSREAPAEATAVETPTDGTSVAEPTSALDGLLFLAHVQTKVPADGQAATATADEAAPAVGTTSALDGLLFLAHVQTKVPADGQAATAMADEAAPAVGATAESAVPTLAGLVANRASVPPAAAGASRGSEGERTKIAGGTMTAPSGTRSHPPVDSTQPPLTALAVDTTAVETTASEPGPFAATAAVEATPFFATAAHAALSVAPMVRVAIDTPVVDQSWRAEMADRLVSLVTRGVEHAQLRLSPADLGPVEVRIDVRGGEASLAIVAAHATTREALDQALPLLRDMLAREGLSLGEATVRDGSADGQPSARGHAGSEGRMLKDEATERRADEAASLLRAASARRLVDVFA